MYVILEKFFSLIDKFHQKRIITFLKSLSFSCVIDVGAHKGSFISDILLLKKINKIYAFEPQVDIFNILKKKYLYNKDIEIYNLALDSEIAKKDIYINKISSTSTLSKFNTNSFFLKMKNFITFSKNNYIRKYQIQTNTIDNQFKNIKLEETLLKIDVEGFELDVLMGGENKISNEIQYILIEHKYSKQYSNSKKEQVHEFLVKKKFKIEKVFFYPTFHFKDVLYKKIYNSNS